MHRVLFITALVTWRRRWKKSQKQRKRWEVKKCGAPCKDEEEGKGKAK